jgi:kynurenine 3-monooxygenase
MSRAPVTIIGAGLCGSLLSIILARRGVKATVLERQPDPRTTKVAAGRSINLALSARGIRALQHAGIFDRVEPLLMPMKGRLIHEDGHADDFQSYGQKDDEKIFSVSRAELNRILVDTADTQHGVKIRFQQEAVSYYPDEATLRVRDHEKSADYDVKSKPIIAADGAGSVIRRAYGESAVTGASESLLEHGYKELTIPAGADGQFQLENDVLHIWPRGGFMLIALPNPTGDFTLTLFMPTSGNASFASLDSEEHAANFFATHFPGVVPLVDNLAATITSNPIGILGTVRCNHWHDGQQMLLIGDAAHAVVPFHGQGMNLAFEDCVVLDQVMENPDADWNTIFEVFEAEQIANANAIADMALDNYVEMRDRVRDPKYVLRKELSFELERRLPNRFIPRYSMVMFHDEIPYAVAQERGAIQQKLLEELTAGADSMQQINIDAAVAETEKRIAPLH